MITVNILINDKTIYTRSARNIGLIKSKHNYRVDDGRIIKVYGKHDAIKLAVEMLGGIKNIEIDRHFCDDCTYRNDKIYCLRGLKMSKNKTKCKEKKTDKLYR